MSATKSRLAGDCAADNEVSLPPENVFGHTKKLRLILESIDAHRPRIGGRVRVLDVGCGNGTAVSQFLTRADDRYLGIDIHAPSIEFARDHFGSPAREFVLRHLDRIVEEQFDVVVLSDVLEHVADPEKLFRDAAARTAAGGIMLVSVPNGRGPFELESRLSRVPVIGAALLWLTDALVAVLDRTVFRGRWRAIASGAARGPYNVDSGHLQFFGTEDVPALALSSGLTLLRRSNLSFLSGPFTNYLFSPFESFIRWNVRVSDRLSSKLVSAWYFEFSNETEAHLRHIPDRR